MLLLGTTFLFWVALYLYVPTLPTYVKTKTLNLATVGMVLSMYGLWQALARLPMGIAAGALGRGKPLIILGLLFCSAGAFIMGRGNSILVLAIGRAFTGLSASTWVLLIVVFSTFFEEEKAIFSSALLTFAASFGRLLSTSSNGFLNRAGGYPLAFHLAGVFSLLAIVLVLFVQEKDQSPMDLSLKAVAKLVVRKDVILPTCVSIMVHYGDWGVTFGFLPILAHQMGMGDVAKSMLIGTNIMGITAATLLNTLVLKRGGHIRILLSGALLFFFGIMLIAFSPSRGYLFAGTGCMGFAFGIVYPILVGMSIQKVERSQRTTAMGIHQAFYAIGMFTGPWLTGIIADYLDIRPTFFLTAGFYLILVLLFLYLLNKNERS
jgi:MFS family permease